MAEVRTGAPRGEVNAGVRDDALVPTAPESSTTPESRSAREGAAPFVVTVLAAIERRAPALTGFTDATAAVFARYSRHRGSVLAAGFAFYSLLAVVPAAIALGSIAALTGDPQSLIAALERAVERVPSLAGPGQDTVTGLLSVVEETSSASFGLTTIVSTLLAVYASSRVFVTVTAVLDVAFHRPMRDRSWLVRVIATAATLAALVVIVLGFVALQALPPALDALGVDARVASTLRWISLPLLVVAGFVAFSLAYRWGSPRAVSVGRFNRGGAVAMTIALVGTGATSVYISYSSALGSAIAVLGGAIIVQLWLYVIGIALMVGAEVEAVLTDEPRAPE